MCTDNMPSGTAMKLGRRPHDPRRDDGRGAQHRRRGPPGDGRRARPGGRGAGVDAIVDIATLTGAAMRTFGVGGRRRARQRRRPASTQLEAAGDATDEPVWELPLVPALPPQLDSTIADIKNMGGAERRAITAGAVPRGVRRRHPVGHLDIAGTARPTPTTRGGSTGATGVRHPAADRAGARLPAAGRGRRGRPTAGRRYRRRDSDDGSRHGAQHRRDRPAARRHRAGRQQGPAPGDHLPRT